MQDLQAVSDAREKGENTQPYMLLFFHLVLCLLCAMFAQGQAVFALHASEISHSAGNQQGGVN